MKGEKKWPEGPWAIHGDIVWAPKAKKVVCQLSTPKPASGQLEHERAGLSADDFAGTAHLIAAAPLLRDALDDLIDQVHSLPASAGTYDLDLTKSYAALAAALPEAGKEPSDG